ncbi:hypothetical protein [Dyella amyloliquefaciens]|uniref:hypothetical protein n=1 Tax=Dyella amyloliquefaciens TaxID=1770545 RepID=UPI001E4016D2|nr:hypothetical protein [Dyella amyloliquefaciens]
MLAGTLLSLLDDAGDGMLPDKGELAHAAVAISTIDPIAKDIRRRPTLRIIAFIPFPLGFAWRLGMC